MSKTIKHPVVVHTARNGRVVRKALTEVRTTKRRDETGAFLAANGIRWKVA